MSPAIIGVKARVFEHRHSPCIAGCSCNCHTPRHFRSPPLLDAILGPLFAGYSGYPLRNFQRCSVKECLGQTDFKFHIKYYFPSWFLGRMLAMKFNTQLSGEPSIGLTIRRTVASNSDLFRLMSADDADGLRRLFASRSASPNDIVYVSGMTALHVGRIPHSIRV